MIELSFESVAAMVALVILLGSLIGSSLIFISGGGSDSDGSPGSGYSQLDWRPANSQHAGETYVTTGGRIRPPRRISLVSILLFGGVAALGATAGYAMYKSPWSVETDLRHYAATLHCDLAEKVGLAPARSGEPGYHLRNDRDADGVSCEIPTAAAAIVEPERKTASTSLATPQLGWPAGVMADGQ